MFKNQNRVSFKRNSDVRDPGPRKSGLRKSGLRKVPVGPRKSGS